MRRLTLISILVIAANIWGQAIISSKGYLSRPYLFSDIEKEYTKHRIKRGDTYIKLSRHYYGTDKYWRAIQSYNNNYSENNLKPGEFLKIPVQPSKFVKQPAKSGKTGKVAGIKTGTGKNRKLKTVEDIYSFLKNKISSTLVSMKLGSKNELPVSIFLLLGIFLYVLTDFILILPSFFLLSMKDENPVKNSLKLSLASFVVQFVILVCIALVGYLLINNSDSWNEDTILKMQLDSYPFIGSALSLSVLCYLLVPLICVKTMFNLSPFKSFSIVTLPFVLKTIVSVFPVLITYLVTDYTLG